MYFEDLVYRKPRVSSSWKNFERTFT